MHAKQLSIILVALIAVGSSSLFARSGSMTAGSDMKKSSTTKKNAGMKSGAGMQMKGAVKFKVRIENISSADGFTASNGTKWPFAISPGAYAVHRGAGNPLFNVGKYVGKTGLE